MTEWRLIETAPKDALLLLACEFMPNDWRIKIGGWREDVGGWQIFGASWEPTHWMPLPAPPTGGKHMQDDHECPICAVPFKTGDLCSTDIDLGICHAECLEGSLVVDLDTGDPVDGPAGIFSYEPPKTQD
ncbi:DUF551 domain-containing protein [Oricola thermophila]|uniref:DUF551 domain-containing protein n=1 Tax=Oricola thermophila TaxID=2742145 RepID=UPI003D18130A